MSTEQLKGVASRFWSHVDKGASVDGCWNWTAATSDGYGRFSIKHRLYLAHRVAWELEGVEIPPGLQIDHLCRNRKCVNPQHLEVVDGRTNTLRGTAPSAFNSVKTHCPRGHALDGENLLVVARNGVGTLGRKFRKCRTCQNETYKRYRIAKKARTEGVHA